MRSIILISAGFQSTPPARGATGCCWSCGQVGRISIHAPREGGDARVLVRAKRIIRFQSTPPARGATLETGVQSGK